MRSSSRHCELPKPQHVCNLKGRAEASAVLGECPNSPEWEAWIGLPETVLSGWHHVVECFFASHFVLVLLPRRF